ncbi:hypothetical protein SK128_016691, partial [Halocaridina rubra]
MRGGGSRLTVGWGQCENIIERPPRQLRHRSARDPISSLGKKGGGQEGRWEKVGIVISEVVAAAAAAAVAAAAVVPLITSFLILSLLVTPHIHLNILISATSSFFSCVFFIAHVSAPYIIAGLPSVLCTLPLNLIPILLSHSTPRHFLP